MNLLMVAFAKALHHAFVPLGQSSLPSPTFVEIKKRSIFLLVGLCRKKENAKNYRRSSRRSVK
jgi:hypothetical protein